MSVITDNEKRNSLMFLIQELAIKNELSEDAKEKYNLYIRLENIYTNGFRHYYSDVFSAVSTIVTRYGVIGLQTLEENINLLAKGYQADKSETVDISNQLNKLYDHIHLDIERIRYISKVEELNRSTVKSSTRQVSILQEDVKEVKNITSNVKHMQTQYITILGIFAAIVIGFVGSMAFSTSVLQKLGDVPTTELCAIACVVGGVFFTIIFFLLDFLKEINVKEKRLRRWYPLIITDGILAIGAILFTMIH